jgi:hypothetical protein
MAIEYTVSQIIKNLTEECVDYYVKTGWGMQRRTDKIEESMKKLAREVAKLSVARTIKTCNSISSDLIIKSILGDLDG